MRSLRAVALVAATTAVLLGLGAPAHADTAHTPITNCEPPVQQTAPVVVFFAGEAHVPAGHAADVNFLTVTCTYSGRNVWHSVEATANGPVVAFATYGGFYWNEFDTVCQSAEVRYADGHYAVASTVCSDVGVSANTGPPPESAPTLRCDHTRSPAINAWVVEATAFAGARADAPLTTDVSCTLRDAAGAEITARATAAGGVAVASAAERSSIAAPASKCYAMTVDYFASGTLSSSACETY